MAARNETPYLVADDHVSEVREPAGYRRCDADIAREVRERLADDVGLDASGIEIEVKDCQVTMRGMVRHRADAKRAEAHGCAVVGVTAVRNELQYEDRPPSPMARHSAGAAAKMGKPTYER